MVSRIELLSVMAGITAVYLAAKEKILTWPIGLINIATAFFIYYHVHLYSDMFLQIYFFGISIYGWTVWRNEKREKLPLKWMDMQQRVIWALIIAIFSMSLGLFMNKIHFIFPNAFPNPAAFPFADSLVAVASVAANTLMAKRYIENWILWIGIDVICVFLYFEKDIVFIALEFLVFLVLACYGLAEWIRLHSIQKQRSNPV